jgi:hypothetical protein
LGIWAIFSQFIGTIVSPLSMFFINQSLYFTKNHTNSYIYLGLWCEFEFGPQRIRNLAILCP